MKNKRSSMPNRINKIQNIMLNIILGIILYTFTTMLIQAIICPKMTQREIFLNAPNSFILKWKTCEKT